MLNIFLVLLSFPFEGPHFSSLCCLSVSLIFPFRNLFPASFLNPLWSVCYLDFSSRCFSISLSLCSLYLYSFFPFLLPSIRSFATAPVALATIIYIGGGACSATCLSSFFSIPNICSPFPLPSVRSFATAPVALATVYIGGGACSATLSHPHRRASIFPSLSSLFLAKLPHVVTQNLLQT